MCGRISFLSCREPHDPGDNSHNFVIVAFQERIGGMFIGGILGILGGSIVSLER